MSQMNRVARTLLSAFLIGLPMRVFPAVYRGQVLVKNPDLMVVQGKSWSGWVFIDTVNGDPCTEGDIVEITGNPSDSPALVSESIVAKKITVIGHEALPQTIDAPGGKITDGSLTFSFVRTEGTVVSVSRGIPGWNWMVLRSQTGDFGVSVRDTGHSLEELRKLIDAEVSVRGIVVYSWDKRQLGAHLSLRGDDALKILRAPPDDAFGVPPLNTTDLAHRQSVRGTVLATGSRTVMIRTKHFGTIKAVPSAETKTPAVGRLVTAVGFAKADPVRLMLDETLFRDEGPSELVSEVPKIPQTEALRSGDLHGSVAVFQGTVRGHIVTPGLSDFISLETEHGPVSVDLSSIRATLADAPQPGAVLRITGVCVIEYECASPADAFPRFRGITLLPRTADDLVIVKRPPWWTPGKFILCLTLLILLACLREWFVRSSAKIKLRERTSLAIELHDFLAQFLTGVSLQLDAASLAHDAGNADKIKLHIANARNALRSCRENLRYCLSDLRRDISPRQDLQTEIHDALIPYLGGTALAIRFPTSHHAFTDVLIHTVISVARELAINAIRHGNATRIRIAGEWRDGRIRFVVHDNGSGFDPASCPGSAHGHYGLQGVRERLRQFHGQMDLSSRPGHGTTVRITLTP